MQGQKTGKPNREMGQRVVFFKEHSSFQIKNRTSDFATKPLWGITSQRREEASAQKKTGISSSKEVAG